MDHLILNNGSDSATLAEVALKALREARRSKTSRSGSVFVSDGQTDADGIDLGTGTIINGVDGGIQPWVGHTTPPGKPTGITALSHMRTVFVNWDGSLDGGVPKAFLFVRLHISYVGGDGATVESDLGDLYGPGGAASVNLPEGTVVTVTARAYDNAHDATGRWTPNVSVSSEPVTVTVVDDAAELQRKVEADIKVVSDKADEAHGVADDAAAANTKLREDTAASLEAVNTAVAGVRTDVDAVSEKATTLASGLDSANTKITSTSDKLTGLTTTVSNVSKTADDAMALSTTNHQDLTGFQTTVQQTYSTKDETLSQVNAVSQKADSLSATLSKDYQKTADSDAKYATQAALQATSSSISASVAETYATKSVVDQLKNIADNAIETWQGHGAPTMTGEPTSDWTTTELKKQHSGDMYYDLDTGYSYRFGSADGSTYTWDKISDSDITRAMQAAADAQSAADKANSGVSKLNTDIPATYATKSDVKITTDGIKTDVSKAMTLGQTGIDNASAVNQKADGIQATVTQQAQTLSDNVKAIAQVNMRADSLSTSISQVNTKTDVALANAANYIKNPQFHGSNLDSVRTTQMDASDSNAGTLPTAASTYGKNTSGYDCVADSVRIRAIAGHTYRIEIDSKPASDMPSTETEPFGLMYWRMAADNPGITTNQYTKIDTVATTVTDWTHSKMEFTYTGTEPWSVFRPAYRAKYSQRWLVTNFSCTDVTEVVAAQSSADTALSQVSTLSQDLSGFKTQVTQTYETKDASTAKATTAQQNLDGFKTSVASTYASKSDVAATYATKSDVTQTSDSLTAQISAVGTDATSALNKATTAQQNLDGFKNTVSATYATKTALDTTNGNVTQAQATGDKAIFAALPSLADKTQANSWLCAIFPTGNGSVQDLPSYSLIASLAASYTKYQADGTGDILNGSGVDWSYGLIRTLVSFSADKTWTFTYCHDDGSRIYVDGVNVFERAEYTLNDPVTISFTKGNHIVDVMYSNGLGGYGIWGFSVALSSIATTMYAPAGASVLATALDKAQKDATTALSQYSTLSQDLSGFKTSVSQTYTKQTDFNNLSGKASQSFQFSTPGNVNNYWYRLGILKNDAQGKTFRIDILANDGQNGNSSQNIRATITIVPGCDGGGIAKAFGVAVTRENWQTLQVMVVATARDTCEVWVFNNIATYFNGTYTIGGYWESWTDSPTYQTDPPSDGSSQDVGYRLNPEQLQSDVAATYATKSSVQQTAAQITSQVETKYATKDDVASKYTTLQQTDSAFDARIGTAQSTAANAQSNAADAQNRAGVLETLIHSDANGVRVGKTVNGSYTGYSALVNSNGSFDVLNPAGQMVNRFNSDGIQMPSGIVSVNGIPMVEDITDQLVFMNTYWQYSVKATRIFNQVIMQVWCRRHGDPAGDFVPGAWIPDPLFKIKRGYRPYGVPGDTHGQDMNFPMANNALTDFDNIAHMVHVSPVIYAQVTDTFITIRSSYGKVRYKNDITWLSGVVSWVIDPDHQTGNDDTPTQN